MSFRPCCWWRWCLFQLTQINIATNEWMNSLVAFLCRCARRANMPSFFKVKRQRVISLWVARSRWNVFGHRIWEAEKKKVPPKTIWIDGYFLSHLIFCPRIFLGKRINFYDPNRRPYFDSHAVYFSINNQQHVCSCTICTFEWWSKKIDS